MTIDRPERRNAVDGPTAAALLDGFQRFAADDTARMLVLTGAGGVAFCAGADLKAITTLNPDAPGGPLGFTRLQSPKPTIAAIDGWCLAGGFELALWCDLRIATAVRRFGCAERRWGVPLIDGGTQRLPRIVGLGRALDLILTGRTSRRTRRSRSACQRGRHRPAATSTRALEIAEALAAFPQETMLSDRRARSTRWASRTRPNSAARCSSARRRRAPRFAGGAGAGAAPGTQPTATGRGPALTYFVTGATGFIGRHLVERLLERDGDIYVLVREGSRDKLDELIETLGPGGPHQAGVGDLDEPELGVDDDARSRRGNVDHFFHLAAIYDMTADEERNVALNVGGTQNAIDLANALEAGTFHHVSSIAAAGLYEGHFTEDMFDEGQKLAHPYHRTKFESEQLAREREEAPWRVYRPSIVVGNSKTGEMDKIDGPYYFFKAIQKIRNALPQWVPLIGPSSG